MFSDNLLGRITEHIFRTAIECFDEAFFIDRDNRHTRRIEDGLTQLIGFLQALFRILGSRDIGNKSLPENAAIIQFFRLRITLHPDQAALWMINAVADPPG